MQIENSESEDSAIQKENLDPKKFVEQAWHLIQSARQHVLRRQTNAEYLAYDHGSHVAAENVVKRISGASRVPFKKLCDPERNKGDTEIIKLHDAETGKTIEVEWKVYRGEGGERAFANLFWDYWNANSIIRDKDHRMKYGEAILELWKRDGIPSNDFLALAMFRRE